jgi:hypothetical protein
MDTNQDTEFQQRRRWRRYSFQTPVRISFPNGPERAAIRAIATELNEGGVALRTATPLQIADELEIEFLPVAWDRPILAKGTVCSRAEHKGQYGVVFHNITLKQRGDLYLLRETMRSSAVDYWYS